MQSPINIEQQLLADLARGDRKATEQVYKQYYKMVTAWIQQNGGSEADAADVYQEAVTILFEKAQSEDFRLTCKLSTYLFAVGKHLWYKKVQQLQKRPGALPENFEDEGGDVAYEDDINSHHERELHYANLDSALGQLGEPCRSLLKAFYQQDKSMQEIAAEFGYTNPENAKTQKYKCLTRLRKIFYGVQANGN